MSEMAKQRQQDSTKPNAPAGTAPRPAWSITAAATLSATASHCRVSRTWPSTNETMTASITIFRPKSGAIRDASTRLRAAKSDDWPSR